MPVSNYHTVIIGSGCAGFNAADWLYDLGVRDIAVVTEGVSMGTSRNTGSDKQTYYKLTLSGGEPDSVREMAAALFNGGGVNGDTALAEAAGSVKSFFKLVNLGVPFPCNEYGEYAGYRTDHDTRRRATSCGPLTSKLMTEALEGSVRRKGVPVLDNRQAVKLLTDNGRVYGLIVLNTGSLKYETLYCGNVILATGGPAGVYSEVVYPESQTGGTGLAIEAGARMCNLQEWQYGLASTGFRWNVSGTYQQALPRYISVSPNGTEREFLPPHFPSPARALDMVFLKGYQWPFDVRKIDGSSGIDILVAEETAKGNDVYMDFRSNPSGLEAGYAQLNDETRGYLEKSGAGAYATPAERLAKMNPNALELYRVHGIDLYARPLRVAVCAQHCNGGVEVDSNWESSVTGLYAVGEAAGTFGAYRPGGSALNSAQVGAMRAAEHIAGKRKDSAALPNRSKDEINYCNSFVYKPGLTASRLANQTSMSRCASFIRDAEQMKQLRCDIITQLDGFFCDNRVASGEALPYLHKSYDILLTQAAVLSAMICSAETLGSHGGALVKNVGGAGITDSVIITHNGASFQQPVRPLPPPDDWFESVWERYALRQQLR